MAREAEFRAALDAAATSGTVAISGMPGVGKTRLAARVEAQALRAQGR